MTKIPVLDGIGFVELLDVFGDDLTVVNAARVSLHKESALDVDGALKTGDDRLINYLATHNHDSPFFHPQIRLRIKMPICIAREWFRHTVGLSRNEVSRRYVTTDPECYIPQKLRARAENVKQGSTNESIEHELETRAAMAVHAAETLNLYKRLLAEGVCPEQARMILPQSMYTEFIETGSLAAYARIFGLRAQPDAQREIQEYARAVAELVEPKFPASWKALTGPR